MENLGVAQQVTDQLHDPTGQQQTTGPRPPQAPAPPADEAPPPVLQLPHVELPPAPADPPRAAGGGGLRTALVSVGMVFGSILVAAGFLAAIVYVGVLTGRFVFFTIAFVLAIPFVRALVVLFKPRRPPTGTHLPGWTLAPGEEPRLEAFVAQVAEQVGTRPPDEITLHVHVMAGVQEDARLLGLVGGRRRLVLGIPLFDSLDVTQLRAILAHEFTHYTGRHVRSPELSVRMSQALALTALGLGERSVLGRAIGRFWAVHRDVIAACLRNEEQAADRAAVRLAGRQGYADALQAMIVSRKLDEVLQSYIGKVANHRGVVPWDLQYGYWRICEEPSRVAHALRDLALEVPQKPWDSHPPYGERIRHIGALPEPAEVPAHDGRAARLLLREPNELVEAIRFGSVLPPGTRDLPRATWEELAPPAYESDLADASLTVDELLERMGMSLGVRGMYECSVAKRDRELMSRLVSVGWDATGLEGRMSVQRTALHAVAVRDALLAGRHTLTLSFSLPVGLADETGEEVPLRSWIDAVIAGDWAPLARGLGFDQAMPVIPPPDIGDKRALFDVRVIDVIAPRGLARAEPPWMARTTMQGRFPGQELTVAVAETCVEVGGKAITFDDVRHLTIRWKQLPLKWSLGRIEVVLRSGETRTIKVWAHGEDGEHTRAIAVYVGSLLNVKSSVRRVEEAIVQVADGGTVTAGGLVFTQTGLATVAAPQEVTPWPDVAGGVRMRKADAWFVYRWSALVEPLRSDGDACDALMVGRLVSQMRTLWG
jgi:Zn-dependent protease with chaperone function